MLVKLEATYRPTNRMHGNTLPQLVSLYSSKDREAFEDPAIDKINFQAPECRNGFVELSPRVLRRRNGIRNEKYVYFMLSTDIFICAINHF